MFDSETGVKFDEFLIYEMSSVVGYDSVGHSVPAYDVFPYKLLDLLCCDYGQWLSLYPFCKIVNANNEELYLSLPWGEWSQDVHSPFCKWPWGEYEVQYLLFLVDEIALFLTWYAFFYESLIVCFHGRPKVAGFEYSGHHSSCTRIVAAYSLMYFSKYVLCLFLCNTFEQGLSISTLV